MAEEAAKTFELGLDAGDIKRIVWSFVFTAIPVVIAMAAGWLEGQDAWWVPLGSALLSFVKNFSLSNESALK